MATTWVGCWVVTAWTATRVGVATTAATVAVGGRGTKIRCCNLTTRNTPYPTKISSNRPAIAAPQRRSRPAVQERRTWASGTDGEGSEGAGAGGVASGSVVGTSAAGSDNVPVKTSGSKG